MVRRYSSLSALGSRSGSPTELISFMNDSRGPSRRPRESIRVSATTVIAICAFFAVGSAGITTFVLKVRHASTVTALVEQEREDVDRLVRDKDIVKNRWLASDEDTRSCQEDFELIEQRLDLTEIHLKEAYSRVEADDEAAREANEEIERLHENLTLLQQSNGSNAKINANIQVIEMKEENDATIRKLHEIQAHIALISKREALRRFGEGPHQVKIVLDFPPEPALIAPDGTTPRIIVLEMASLELMPHSVYLFLSMVDAGLWNGSSFISKADHALQASPRPYYKNEGDDVYRNFIEAGLTSVAFQEYSDQFSHKEYTVGFGGRPGGPEFYFNMEDNTEFHGPGGQTHEADPCFAKVLHGFDAIDRMMTMPLLPGGYSEMEKHVGIEGAYILPSHELLQNA